MDTSDISEQDVARYWDGNADSWSAQVRKGWDTYREYLNNPAFFRFIGNLKGKAVLDAGCGEGYNTRILARKGARVVGVDISPRMLDLARSMEQREPLGICYELASFSNLSVFPDASFDAVVSTMALMDGPNYAGALREFYRVLRKRGKLFFSISHPCFMTRGYGWLEDDCDGLKITASDYFNTEPWVERWAFSHRPAEEPVEPFAIPAFPRTLSDYINTLIRSGFVLKRIQEPRPSERTCRKHPWLQRWRGHAAIFLHIHAVKA